MLEFCSVDLSSPQDPTKYGDCKLASLVAVNYVHACRLYLNALTVDLDSVPRTISVQSSYKLNLPPYLLIHAADIKLMEPIGQGA